jgi:hypothetical protein
MCPIAVPTRRCLVIMCALLGLCALVTAWSLLRRETLVPVAGQVTVDGKPVIAGTILFSPNKAKGNTHPLSIRGEIKDGVYIFLSRGKDGVVRSGVPPGWYRVTVEGFVGSSKRAPLGHAEVLRQLDLIMEARDFPQAEKRGFDLSSKPAPLEHAEFLRRLGPIMEARDFFSNYDTPHPVEVIESTAEGSWDVQLTRKSTPRRK